MKDREPRGITIGRRACALLVLVAAFALAAEPVAAKGSASLCLDAIAGVERREPSLPDGLLQSIALVESGYRAERGGRYVPWPWAVNSPQGAFYLGSRREAIAKVEELQRLGITNIDVGCMQINLEHHPRAFASLDSAFHPEQNVAYAADFLASLMRASPDLFKAVGRYHSATPKRRDAYARKVFARWDKDTGIAKVSKHGLGAPASPRLTTSTESTFASGLSARPSDDAGRPRSGSIVADPRWSRGSWLGDDTGGTSSLAGRSLVSPLR